MQPTPENDGVLKPLSTKMNGIGHISGRLDSWVFRTSSTLEWTINAPSMR